MTNKLKPCPFCDGEAKLVICDEEGNFKDDSYADNPCVRHYYAIVHTVSENEDCPIAHDDERSIGIYFYENKIEAIKAWNQRSY